MQANVFGCLLHNLTRLLCYQLRVHRIGGGDSFVLTSEEIIDCIPISKDVGRHLRDRLFNDFRQNWTPNNLETFSETTVIAISSPKVTVAIGFEKAGVSGHSVNDPPIVGNARVTL